MNLQSLKEQAKKILAINEKEGDFENRLFSCGSGGAPANKAGIPEVLRSEVVAYTTHNDTAYEGTVVILCKETGVSDNNSCEIYITPDGQVFVYDYHPGNAASFDYGYITEPNNFI